MRHIFLILALTISFGALARQPLSSQETATQESAKLVIAAVRVEPAQPAADTLCRLSVEIQNQGDQTATQLGFTVKINGKRLPVYENHLFMFPLVAGAKSELSLFNFWSTETSRPEPASGKLEVEVTLREARWMDISTEGDTETWTPLGAVAGLPVRTAITVPMSKRSSG